MIERFHADEVTRSFVLEIEGVGTFDEWTMAEVQRDMKDFSGSFNFSLRDATRTIATLSYATLPAVFRVRPGPRVKVYVDGTLELVGFIEKVTPDINDDFAEVTISGRDTTGDLIDCACAPDGPGEYRKIKLEDAVSKIAEPFGIKVRSEIDTGPEIERYALGVAETCHSAIEKFSRQKHALVLADGAGDVVITRTGATRAPADLTLPGNMKGSNATYSHENRFSDTIVHGQPEGARGARKDKPAAMTTGDAPMLPDNRKPTDGAATEQERRGVATKGRAVDAEIKRWRPIVHLSKAQPDDVSADDEADFRMRTARAESEELTTTVNGYGVNGQPWLVNQMVFVGDNFQGVHRDMVIARTGKTYDNSGRLTQITVNSPEAFDKAPTGSRRANMDRS